MAAHRKRINRACKKCGKEFETTPASRQTYCSRQCRIDDNWAQTTDPQKKSVFVCKWCGKEFTEWTYRNPTMCSKQCASEYGAHQPRPNQRRPENRVAFICAFCGKEFTTHKSQNENGRSVRYCSVVCKLRSRVSSPEMKCKKILECAGIAHEHQRQIKIGFFVDFVIGDNVIIQIDGEYWHGHPRFSPLTDRQLNQRKKDAAQDKYLIACGYTVIRVWESDVTPENILTLLQYS